MNLRNPLVTPEAFETPDFETLLAEQKEALIAFVRESDESQATALEETLASDSELLTKFLRQQVLSMQERIRQANAQYLQTLPDHAIGSNLDAIVARLGLVRRENESDDDLRQRYYLSLTKPARGTKLGYIASARLLDEEPNIKLINIDKGFSLEYSFGDTGFSGLIKDVNAVNPNPGEVDIIFLAHDSSDNDRIQQALDRHFRQEKLLTDKVTVMPAEELPYSLDITLGVYEDPDADTIELTARESIEAYLAKQTVIGATIEPTEIIHLGREAGASRVVLYPSEPVVASEYQVAVNQLFNFNTDVIWR